MGNRFENVCVVDLCEVQGNTGALFGCFTLLPFSETCHRFGVGAGAGEMVVHFR